uniref:Uncharacterized protein n=1 Tax=Oryza rufipogon TaxID=4529 RepID=A0A0E0QMC4_ORYRU
MTTERVDSAMSCFILMTGIAMPPFIKCNTDELEPTSKTGRDAIKREEGASTNQQLEPYSHSESLATASKP